VRNARQERAVRGKRRRQQIKAAQQESRQLNKWP
jgi:hypothetical protein